MRALVSAASLMLLPFQASRAQVTRTFTACTPDALAACAELRLIAGPSLFEIGIRTLGAPAQPTLPISIYNLVFGTGAPAAPTPVATNVGPLATGGAIVGDASAWELFDAGDALFLSALTNLGVGGCAEGAAIDGFGQAALTCAPGSFVTFAFTPTGAFDPAQFALLNLEAVALIDPIQAASCGAESSACVITADQTVPDSPATTVPEPRTLALLAAGLTVIVVRRARRGTP